MKTALLYFDYFSVSILTLGVGMGGLFAVRDVWREPDLWGVISLLILVPVVMFLKYLWKDLRKRSAE